jgi:hypothetical protein
MKTWDQYIKAPLTGGYRGPIRPGEIFIKPELLVEPPLQNCLFVMNRRNKNVDLEPQPVNLEGFDIDPLLAPNRLMSDFMDITGVRYVFLDDNYSTFDGVSLVLPNDPKPVIEIDGKKLYLVAGLYKNSCKSRTEWNYEKKVPQFFTTLSEAFKADMISLGNPLYGLSPNGKRNYFFGLSEYPIAPFEDKDKFIFSYGGVIAIGRSYHDEFEETGLDTEIRILSPSALKLIEKWRQEATNNVI